MTDPRPMLSRAARMSLAVLAFAGACTKHDLLVAPAVVADTTLPALEERPILAPELSSVKASIPTIAGACGPVSYYPLTNGKRLVGTVNVTNDATNLYVTYWIPVQHAWISDTRLAVEKSAALIPRDPAGAPAPWSFPHAAQHAPPTTSFTHVVPLTRIGVQAGEVAHLSAMAGVVRPTVESNYGKSWEWLVMWGIGNTPATVKSVVHAYTVSACAGMPVPTTPIGTSGIVTITFDDGYASVHTNAFPVLKSLGLRGNLAVNPTPIDEQWGDYMRMAQVREIHDAGWSVVSHTMDHKDMVTLPAPELEAEIRDAKAWIERNGFGPSSVFIVPFHSWGERERAMVAKYHRFARGHSIAEWSPERYQGVPITQPLDLTGFEPEFAAPWRTAQGRALTMEKVKYAVDNGRFLDLFFHRIEAADVASFRELMSQVAAYKANVRTWKEVAQ